MDNLKNVNIKLQKLRIKGLVIALNEFDGSNDEFIINQIKIELTHLEQLMGL